MFFIKKAVKRLNGNEITFNPIPFTPSHRLSGYSTTHNTLQVTVNFKKLHLSLFLGRLTIGSGRRVERQKIKLRGAIHI